MIDSNILKIDRISASNVSRGTSEELLSYSKEIILKNKSINLISKSSEKIINTRHIEDSAQIIEFIDKKDIKVCTDLGSGAGLPGIVLGILMKKKNPLFKLILYEKSYHKSIFLNEMIKKFKLNSEIHRKNIFDEKNLRTDVIISRAFKPLPIILQIAQNNFKNFKYIVLFLGKSGKKIIEDALKIWKFDYEQKKSLTNDESMIVKISNLQKR
ncbi:class I SAM-dependent methyltransferase [Candidatus Pelagibacter sp.]|nr:class I SAM-dependent methyltransferase [Candidatus Pelagibacter sp.]